MMNEQILKIIEEAEKNGMTRFGLRSHHEKVNVGDDLGWSYNTLDDQEPEELEGICCMSIQYDGFDVENFEEDLETLKSTYHSGCGSIVLVGGNFVDYGNDANEVIISHAVALWVAA